MRISWEIYVQPAASWQWYQLVMYLEIYDVLLGFLMIFVMFFYGLFLYSGIEKT